MFLNCEPNLIDNGKNMLLPILTGFDLGRMIDSDR